MLIYAMKMMRIWNAKNQNLPSLTVCMRSRREEQVKQEQRTQRIARNAEKEKNRGERRKENDKK